MHLKGKTLYRRLNLFFFVVAGLSQGENYFQAFASEGVPPLPDPSLLNQGKEDIDFLKLNSSFSALENKRISTDESEDETESPYEISLTDLIVVTSDSKPGENRFSSLKDLKKFIAEGKASPRRRQFVEQNIRVLGDFQFQPLLAIRELVANSLDSYYYDKEIMNDSKVKKIVQINRDGDHKLSIQDDGIGMSLEDVIYYLLTPARSRNSAILQPSDAVSGVTGRFGQGFFSVLSFLKEPQDKIVIETRKAFHIPFRITLFKQAPPGEKALQLKLFTKALSGEKTPQLRVRIEPSTKKSRGTHILIDSKQLTKEGEVLTKSIIPKYFKHTERGDVRVEGKSILAPPPTSVETISLENGEKVTVKRRGSPQRPGTGTLNLTVNGVLIQEFSFTGLDIYPETTVDFPSQTQLTSDRSTFLFENLANRKTVKTLVAYAQKRSDFPLLNSLMPILGEEGFQIVDHFQLETDHPLLPAWPELQGIQKIEGKTIQFLDTKLFKCIRSNPFSASGACASNTQLQPLLSSKSEEKRPLLQMANAGRPSRAFFLDGTQPISDPYSLDVTHTILKTRESVGDSIPSFQLNSRFLKEPKRSLAPILKEQEDKTSQVEKFEDLSSILDSESFSDFKGDEKTLIKISDTFKKGIQPLPEKVLVQLSSTNKGSKIDSEAYLNLVAHVFSKIFPSFSLDVEHRDWIRGAASFLNTGLQLDAAALNKLILEPEGGRLVAENLIQIGKFLFKNRNHPALPLFLRNTEASLQQRISSLQTSNLSDRLKALDSRRVKRSHKMLKKYGESLIQEIFKMPFDEFFQKSQLPFETLEPAFAEKLTKLYENIQFQEILKKIEEDPKVTTLDLEIRKTSLEFNSKQPQKDVHSPLRHLLKGIQSLTQQFEVFFDLNREALSIQALTQSTFASIHHRNSIVTDFFFHLGWDSNSSSALFQRCHELKLNRCLLILIEQQQNLFKPQKQGKSVDSFLFYFDRLYTEIDESYDGSYANSDLRWIEQLNLDKSPDHYPLAALQLLHKASRRFNPFDWHQNKLLAIEDKPSEEALQRNQISILKEILNKYSALNQIKNIPKFIESIDLLYRNFENWRSIKTLDAFYKKLEESNLLTEETGPLVYAYLFGDKISFLDAPEVQEKQWVYQSLESHPVVLEIMGSDPQLNRKQILAAIQQNPRNFIWIKELVKNSKEAGATEIHVDLMKDEKGAMIVRFTDNGAGVSPENMSYFYVPKFSSKPKTQEDINFGWGFFTLFHNFNEVQVETSPDGSAPSSVSLRINNDHLEIAEGKNNFLDQESFPRGTRLTLRKTGPVDFAEPVFIQYQLMEVVADLLTKEGLPLSVFLNNKQIEGRHKTSLRGRTPLTENKILYASDKPPVLIQGFAHSKKGIFYNGIFQTDEIEPYLTGIPPQIRTKLDSLPYHLAIQVQGTLAQNSTRTQFLNQEALTPAIREIALETLLKILTKYSQENPDFLQADFPYDFFDDFRVSGINPTLIPNTPGISFEEIFKHLDRPGALASYFATAPLFEDSSTGQKPLTLVDLKRKVADILLKAKVVTPSGEYAPGAKLAYGLLEREIPGDSLRPLLKKFEYKIYRNLDLNLSQREGNLTEAILGDTSTTQLIKNLENQTGFSSDSIPNPLLSLARTLTQMSGMLIESAEILFGKKILIAFYADTDGSDAKDLQGGKAIEFNIRGASFARFHKMIENRTFNLKAYLDILSTLTHELVHSEETEGSVTHDQSFLSKQQELLEQLYLWNQKPETLKHLARWVETL